MFRNKNIQNIFNLFFFTCTLVFSLKANAQEIRVIDNKGSLKIVNNNRVTTSTSSPIDPIEGDVWFDTNVPNSIKIRTSNNPGPAEWKDIEHTGVMGSVFFAGTDGKPNENNTQFSWNNTSNTLFPTNLNVTGTYIDSSGDVGTSGQILSSTVTGTNWINNSSSNNNIYTTDGTLSTARILNGGSNPLTFNNINNFSLNSINGISTNSVGATTISSGGATTITSTGATVINATAGVQINNNTSINSNLELNSTLQDTNNDVGTSGQILSSTVTGIDWIDNPANNNWLITGNTGTSPTTNFLGTIDTQDFVIRTGNTEKIRVFGTKGQVLINQAPTFNDHPLVVRANGVDVLAFQDATGTPKWHWNLLANGLNFVESGVLDFRLFLENGGNVGVNTNDPTERLDVDGKLRVRDITTVTTNNDILTVTTTGVVEKKELIAAETDNQITTGINGGVYLGPTVYTGSFIINAPGGTATVTFNQAITGLPFQPSQITFVAHPNINSLSIDDDNGTAGGNTTRLDNTYGTMNGFIRNFGGTTTESVMFSGGSGTSINDISRFSSSNHCIGIRFTNQNGQSMGKITATLGNFLVNGYDLDITYTLGISTDGGGGAGRIDRNNDVMDENLVVFYTAYK